MTMVERVARAICARHERIEDQWRGYVPDAYAAIAALRKPTETMVSAGTRCSHYGDASATSIYWAMINAALKETDA